MGQKPFVKQIDIFVSGEGGYHTFRIPAMVVSTKGTILAFCEARQYSSSDFGNIDVVLRRSFDNGKTWQPVQVIADDGRNKMGEPSPVVDRTTGTIWLLLCRNAYQVYVMKSKDDGATWSSPLEITEDVKKGNWSRYATGPCHGIQLKNGKLVVTAWHSSSDILSSPTYSHVIYSDDHGSSWRLGGTVGPGMNECTVVQTSDDSLYLNMRTNCFFIQGEERVFKAWSAQDRQTAAAIQGMERRVRAYARSKDDGMTWSEVKFDDTLIEPPCQASVIRFTDKDSHDRKRVLFSNPASRERLGMTVRLSYDECQTWGVSKLLYRGPSAYSDLAIASDMTICCLYERGWKSPYEKMTFANLNLKWLTDEAAH